MEYAHVPVMPGETLDGLKVRPDGVYLDGTLGGAGHAALIAERLTPSGMLIGIDRDGDALARAESVLAPYAGRCRLFRGNYIDAREILNEIGVKTLDGVLLDLGVSSYQLDKPERGFSYVSDARPDMRMDVRQKLTAYEIINSYTEKQLTELIFAYGEERFARRIAASIVRERKTEPIGTTLRFADIIINAIPAKARAQTGGHPAKRTFQAVRIAVNDELSKLGQAVKALASMLNPGGRICVITFHSLEDREVKNAFKTLNNPCVCPRDLPMCVCGRKRELEIITRKPVTPSASELDANRRSHSAKLRVAEKVLS